MKSILICGAFSTLNKGDEARIKSFLNQINKVSKQNYIIGFLSSNPELDSEIFKRDFNIKMIDKYPLLKGKNIFLKGIEGILNLITALLYKTLKIRIPLKPIVEISKFETIIDFSGESFSDYFGQISLLNTLYPIILGILLQKKIILNAQSIGPFNNRLTKLIVNFCLNNVNLITLRDRESLHYVRDYGVKKPAMHLVADPAFLLEPISLPTYRFNKNKLLIAISISRGSFTKTTSEINLKKKIENYIVSIARIITWLNKAYNAEVFFIPHVLIPTEDDRDIYRDLQKKLNNDKLLKCVNPEYGPGEMKGIIKEFDLLISSRMHPVIASLSLCIPTIAVAYSHKMTSLMREVGLENYVIEIKDISFEILKEKIITALDNRKNIQETLMIQVEELKSRAEKNVKLVSNTIA